MSEISIKPKRDYLMTIGDMERDDPAAEWLRGQIAFAIFNSTNPAHVRDLITLSNISGNPTLTTPMGGGYTATKNLGLDWSMNKDSFLKLADVAIAAFEAADADGSAYAK